MVWGAPEGGTTAVVTAEPGRLCVEYSEDPFSKMPQPQHPGLSERQPSENPKLFSLYSSVSFIALSWWRPDLVVNTGWCPHPLVPLHVFASPPDFQLCFQTGEDWE